MAVEMVTKEVKAMVAKRSDIAEVYFNEKGAWSLHVQKDFPIRISRNEILTGEKDPANVIVTTELSEENKAMIEGIQSELAAAKAELASEKAQTETVNAELTAAKATITELQNKITELTKKK